MPISTKAKSTTLLFKFFSRKNMAPHRNDTTTLPRRTIDTMEIMAPSRLRASAAERFTELSMMLLSLR